MLKAEGYVMFVGSALITPLNDTITPFRVHGTWLFKPTTDCWYVNGRSFDKHIVSDIEEDEHY